MLLHAALAKALAEEGVETIFGQIGDANLFLVDRYVRDEGGRYVGAANEAGAVMMAYGYARRSGRLGVTTVTFGPGLTNTVTALGEAVRGSTPLLVLAGDTPVASRNEPQDIDQRTLVEVVGAGFEPVRSAKSALRDLAVAMRRARTERRPIVLDVPSELMWSEVDYRRMDGATPSVQLVHPDPDALDRAVGVVASVRRPIVLIGRGVTDEARPTVLRLAERIGAPVATTLAATMAFDDEPFALGISGTFSSDVANETILAADCIVAFGASLNRFTTAERSFIKDKAIVHCDVDPAAIGRHVAPTAAVVGDAGVVAAAMLDLIEQADLPVSGFRSPDLANRLVSLRTEAGYGDVSTERTVDIRTAMRRINAAVPANRCVVTDGGRFVAQPIKLLDVPHPSALIYTFSFGSIGLGTGAAIGAAVASPGSPVLFVAGDGGFMSGGLNEFHTAVRENLDLILVLCNDGSYGAEHLHFRARGMDPSLSMFDWPDFAPVADALGGRGVTVCSLADLDVAEQAIAERDRPLLIDLKLDPDQVPRLL
jgi:thiamine pyrophosphate-dependent acetolactate synthase large subunit-like protein